MTKLDCHSIRLTFLATLLLLTLPSTGVPDVRKPGTANILLWQYVAEVSNGAPAAMAVNGAIEVGREILGEGPSFQLPLLREWELLGSGDFDGDGYGDLLWRHKLTNIVTFWRVHGTTVVSTPEALGYAPLKSNGEPATPLLADMNQDGRTDIIWVGDRARRDCWTGFFGETVTPRYWWETWDMDVGTSDPPTPPTITRSTNCGGPLLAVGQFDGKGPLDVLVGTGTSLLRTTVFTGTEFRMADGTRRRGPLLRASMRLGGVGDFDGDGRSDIVWHNTQSGEVTIWSLTADALVSHAVATVPADQWQVGAVGDFNYDRISDIAWLNQTQLNNVMAIWTMGTSFQIVDNGAPGIKVGKIQAHISTMETTKPYGHLELHVWQYAPNFSAGATCPTIDLTLTDSEGVSRSWTGFSGGPFPGRGSQVCDGFLGLTAPFGAYSLRTSAGASTSLMILPNQTVEVEVCSDPKACSPPTPPKPFSFLCSFTKVIPFEGIVGYTGMCGGGLNQGTVISIHNTTLFTIRFPKFGQGIPDCNTPGAVVDVGPGGVIDATGLQPVFGTSSQRLPITGNFCGPPGAVADALPDDLALEITVQGP